MARWIRKPPFYPVFVQSDGRGTPTSCSLTGKPRHKTVFCYFQTVCPLFEPLALLVAASPCWLLGCFPTVSASSTSLTLPIYPASLSPGQKKTWDRTAPPLGEGAELLPARGTNVLYRGIQSGPSPLSAFGETHRQIHAVSSLLPIMCVDLGGKKKTFKSCSH